VLRGIIKKVEIPELGSHWKGSSLLGVKEPAHNKSAIFIVVVLNCICLKYRIGRALCLSSTPAIPPASKAVSQNLPPAPPYIAVFRSYNDALAA
jgi:hypothetical protein